MAILPDFTKTVGPVTVHATYTDALRLSVTVFGIPVLTYALTQEQLVHLGEDAIVSLLPVVEHFAEHVGHEFRAWFDKVSIDVGLLPKAPAANPPAVITPPAPSEVDVRAEAMADLPLSKPLAPLSLAARLGAQVKAAGAATTLLPVPPGVKIMS